MMFTNGLDVCEGLDWSEVSLIIRFVMGYTVFETETFL